MNHRSWSETFAHRSLISRQFPVSLKVESRPARGNMESVLMLPPSYCCASKAVRTVSSRESDNRDVVSILLNNSKTAPATPKNILVATSSRHSMNRCENIHNKTGTLTV